MSKEGHVYQRGETWTYVIDIPPHPITGRRRQKSKGGYPSEEAAWAALEEFKVDMRKNGYFEESSMTYKEYLEYFIENYPKHRRKKIRETTMQNYSDLIEGRIIPALGNLRLKKLTAADIDEAINQWYDEELSSTYIYNLYNMIRMTLNQAVRWKFIKYNPVVDVEVPEKESADKPTWTLEQCKKFLETAKNSKFYSIYLQIIYTGMRRSECIGLLESGCFPDDSYINITQRLTYVGKGENKRIDIDEPKSKKSKRIIPLEPIVAAEIKRVMHQNKINRLRYGADYQDYGLLNCHEDGRPITNDELRYDYEKHVELAGLPYISIHCLRHSFATNLWELEVDIKAISEMLGHSSLQVTSDIYTHMSIDKKRRITSVFGKAMEQVKVVDN